MKKLFLSLFVFGSVSGSLFSMDAGGAGPASAASDSGTIKFLDGIDVFGMNALHRIAESGTVDGNPDIEIIRQVIRYLVARGVNINAPVLRIQTFDKEDKDNDRGVPSVILSGYTALHLAVWMGHVDVVNVLLECGADVNIKNKLKNTAHDIAEIMLAQVFSGSEEEKKQKLFEIKKAKEAEKFNQIIKLLDRSASGAAAAASVAAGVGIVRSEEVSDLSAAAAGVGDAASVADDDDDQSDIPWWAALQPWEIDKMVQIRRGAAAAPSSAAGAGRRDHHRRHGYRRK